MINRLLYYVLPVSLLVLPYVFYATCEDIGFYFAKESGSVEIITAVLLAVAIAVVAGFLVQLITTGAQTSSAASIPFRKLTILWCVVYGLGCIYFLGEEISWGQHLFGWETPDAWKALNDQDETNLHNTSGWLDQVPRTVLTFGILLGGFIYPLVQRGRTASASSTPRSFFSHFMPGWNCVWAGGCVIARELLLPIAKVVGIKDLEISGGEVKESLIAMFLLVYIADLFTRTLRPNPPIDGIEADLGRRGENRTSISATACWQSSTLN